MSANTSTGNASAKDSAKERPNDKDTAKELRREFRLQEWISIGINAVLAIVGILVLCVYNGQLTVMQKTVSEMQRTTEIQERPWLSVEAVPVNGLIFVNGNQPVLKLKFSIRNVGRSIAKGIQVDAKMFPTATAMPVALDAVQRQRELCDHLKISQVGLFDLFPINEPAIRELDISTTGADVERQSISMRGSDVRKFVSLYVVGCATYRSSFSPVFHQTRFSYHLIGPSGFGQNGTPMVAADGMFIMGGFEVGVNVPNDKLGIWQELFGQNEAY